MWVIECLDDVCSDMSVFHGVRDITELDGPTFFKLAWRLPSYEGAVRDRLRVLADEEQEARAEKKQEEHVMTLEEIHKAYPAAPSIGENVPMFEVVRAT